MRIRFASAAMMAAVLTFSVSGVVAADSVSGTYGHYTPTDGPPGGGAICRYQMTDPANAEIYRMVMRAPSVWWPNRRSDVTTEHGRVGWRAVVQFYRNGSWRTLTTTGIQRATAYEDQLSPYGASTKAPFTNISVNINDPLGRKFRATINMYWFRSDGSVLGRVTHPVKWYRLVVGSTYNGTIESSCPTYLGETP